MIKQDIWKDAYSPDEWVRGLTLTIPVQILNSAAFRQVTGTQPPDCPIDARTYAEAGLPFFDLYEEKPSDVSGSDAFGSLQSVNDIEVAQGLTSGSEAMVYPRVVRLSEGSLGNTVWHNGDVFDVQDPDGLLNSRGPRRGFRTLADLEQQVRHQGGATKGK